MIIYGIYDNAYSKIEKKLRTSQLFSTISNLGDNELKLVTKTPVYYQEKEKIAKIQKQLIAIGGIRPISIFAYTEKFQNYKKKRTIKKSPKPDPRKLYLFFDIDSTLTHKHIGTINKTVRGIFEDFKKHDCNLYFCSGRSYQDIGRLTKSYELGEYGIAENGGLILGAGDAGKAYEHGSNTEPLKLLAYLKENQISYREDPNQKDRKTEVVIDKRSITEKALQRAINASGAAVEYNTSGVAYHITKKDKHKGSAIEYLMSDELKMNSKVAKVIGVGDSGLDVKMVRYCDEGYMVANTEPQIKSMVKSDRALKKKVHWLKNSAPYAIEELYKKLFPYG